MENGTGCIIADCNKIIKYFFVQSQIKLVNYLNLGKIITTIRPTNQSHFAQLLINGRLNSTT